ncbi:hypothetical protein [Fuscibacter oryzae]|uniref:Uncharacterized protein n=1 Tax=Fuscibacter oryzae TaxID=2803939 RepID=A0A8J7MWI3_9RHOB|nr:hypothetical protein [Fuscibacter oryzae]MBL4929963.1 hypothetical protein [Fuscibacter oryzae]
MTGVIAAVLLALGPLLAPGLAHAGPVADQAAKADQLAESGDFAGALAAAEEMKAALWDQLPGLTFLNAFPVTERSAGYGLYNPRENTLYKQGEPIQLYAEPQGFGYGDGGEGIVKVGFYVDLQVMGQDGQELANMAGITEIDYAVRAKVREFAADVTYNFEGLGPGKYRLITTLRDKNSAKTGSFETEIEVTDEVFTAEATKSGG